MKDQIGNSGPDRRQQQREGRRERRDQDRPPIGPPGELHEHVERLVLDFDPTTSQFVRLEVSRSIDGIDSPGAYMRFTRDLGRRPPPGISPDAYGPRGPEDDRRRGLRDRRDDPRQSQPEDGATPDAPTR